MELSLEISFRNQKSYKFSLIKTGKKAVILVLGLFFASIAPLRLFLIKYNIPKKNFPQIEKDSILLLFPNGFDSLNLEKNNLNGSTKVNESLIQLLDELKIAYHVLTISKTFLVSTYQMIKFSSNLRMISSSKKIIVSVPGSTGFISTFLTLVCRKKVIFLSHNAELFHRRDWKRNVKKIRQKFLYTIRGLLGLCADILVANCVYQILTLGELEKELYWKRIQFRGKRISRVHYFPYIPPKRLWKAKPSSNRKLVAIIGTYASSIGELRGNRNFLDAGSLINKELKGKDLVLISVGNGNKYFMKFCTRNLGYISDSQYLRIQSSIKGIIIPSDWGWGFKTKIADAVFAEQRIFLPTALYERYPSWQEVLVPINDWNNFVWRDMTIRECAMYKKTKNSQIKLRRQIVQRFCKYLLDSTSTWRIKGRLQGIYKLFIRSKFKVPKNWLNEMKNLDQNPIMLNSKLEIDFATILLKELKLVGHHDRAKNWDLLLSLISLDGISKKARILDAGSGSKAIFASSAQSLGFKRIYACDFQDINVKNIKTSKCDITSTPYPENYFDVIACLSVVEHGVNLSNFSNEMYRICKPGGLLLISTDFWPEEEDHSNKFPYGKENPPMKLFSNSSFLEFRDILAESGWNFLETPSFKIPAQRPITWDRMNASYTFLWCELRK